MDNSNEQQSSSKNLDDFMGEDELNYFLSVIEDKYLSSNPKDYEKFMDELIEQRKRISSYLTPKSDDTPGVFVIKTPEKEGDIQKSQKDEQNYGDTETSESDDEDDFSLLPELKSEYYFVPFSEEEEPVNHYKKDSMQRVTQLTKPLIEIGPNTYEVNLKRDTQEEKERNKNSLLNKDLFTDPINYYNSVDLLPLSMTSVPSSEQLTKSCTNDPKLFHLFNFYNFYILPSSYKEFSELIYIYLCKKLTYMTHLDKTTYLNEMSHFYREVYSFTLMLHALRTGLGIIPFPVTSMGKLLPIKIWNHFDDFFPLPYIKHFEHKFVFSYAISKTANSMLCFYKIKWQEKDSPSVSKTFSSFSFSEIRIAEKRFNAYKPIIKAFDSIPMLNPMIKFVTILKTGIHLKLQGSEDPVFKCYVDNHYPALAQESQSIDAGRYYYSVRSMNYVLHSQGIPVQQTSMKNVKPLFLINWKDPLEIMNCYDDFRLENNIFYPTAWSRYNSEFRVKAYGNLFVKDDDGDFLFIYNDKPFIKYYN